MAWIDSDRHDRALMLTSAVARALLICTPDDGRQDHIDGEDDATWLARLGPGRQRVWRSAARKAVKYILKSRIRGKDHWFAIGTHGAPWTPDTARQEAKRKLGEIAAGKNLAAVREQQRSVLTFTEVVDRFLEERGRASASAASEVIAAALNQNGNLVRLGSISDQRNLPEESQL